MPLQATSGAASYDAFGGGVAVVPNYIEDVFSTWLYTGNGSTQTINNGIDLAGKGGLTWIKRRDAVANHALFDTARGATKKLYSDLTNAEYTDAYSLTSFNADGFSVDLDGSVNNGSGTYASWTFRKQPKFFDVVTYTGNGSNRTIAHNLGSVPGCIIVKRTDTTGDWQVYHRSLANTEYMVLNSTAAKATGTTRWNSTTPTSTVFSLGTDATVNANGGTYVAYLFAHDAGGFGLSGTDNVISCGSFTTDSPSGSFSVDLGYEPQYLLYKASSTTSSWRVADTMRGMPVGQFAKVLFPNTSDAETDGQAPITLTATGFTGTQWATSTTYIYIAIRRGPMRTPTTGTSVFSTLNRTGTGTTTSVTGIGLTPDLLFTKNRFNSGLGRWDWQDRLRGPDRNLFSDGTDAEYSNSSNPSLTAFGMDGVTFGNDQWNGYTNYNSSNTYINYFLRRAPGFFDEVCYTGTGVNGATQAHNLGVTPELIFIKSRSVGGTQYPWLASVQSAGIGFLNTTDAISGPPLTASATTFTLGNANNNNGSGTTYVAYLFASCPGVSKVFNYTGNGSSQTINCGFTGGARFVMIKRTDSTGDWYVWDTARGIVANNDPHLSLNTTAAEVTTNDTIDTNSTGFVVNQVAATNVNVNGASYIGLAIA